MSSTTVPADPTARPATKHIGILLFDDVEELDAVGPWEILANWTLTYPQDGWTVSFVSKDGRSVRAAKGLVLGAHHSFADVPPMQALIHPGGQGTRTLMRDEDHLAWVRGQGATVPLMASVCRMCRRRPPRCRHGAGCRGCRRRALVTTVRAPSGAGRLGAVPSGTLGEHRP